MTRKVFTILWLTKKLHDHIETFLAKDTREAKEYVRKNYANIPIYGVFRGKSTEDKDLSFNDETIDGGKSIWR